MSIDKFKLVKEEQLKNMLFIVITFCLLILKLIKSIFSKDMQFANMDSIAIFIFGFDSSLLKLIPISIKDLQLKNANEKSFIFF